MNAPLSGAIIAAGRGTRIRPLSLSVPKSLLPICNRPIIVHQIDYMKQVGIRDVYIVVGYLKEQLFDYLGDGSRFGVRITYVTQDETKGSGHAVGLLEPHVSGPFLLFLGDICIKVHDLKKRLNEIDLASGTNYLTCRREDDIRAIRKNFTVWVNGDGAVAKVIEKPRIPLSTLKGCGVYLFTPAIFDAIRRTPVSPIRNELELTDAIGTLIEQDVRVCPLEIVEWDVNITFPEDLFYYNFLWLVSIGRERLIGDNVILHKDVWIENSIVGDNVRIERPLRLKKCMIASGQSVCVDGDELSHALILDGHRYQMQEDLI